MEESVERNIVQKIKKVMYYVKEKFLFGYLP